MTTVNIKTWQKDLTSEDCISPFQSTLDWDALQTALTKLDHSHQNFKASVGRSGALSNRRPPSRTSRTSSSYPSRRSSSIGSFGCADNILHREDFTEPNEVNIKVDNNISPDCNILKNKFLFLNYNKKDNFNGIERVDDVLDNLRRRSNYYLPFCRSRLKDRCRDFEVCSTNSVQSFNSCDDSCSVRSEIILRNIKETYSNLINLNGTNTPDLLDSHSDVSSERSFCSSTLQDYNVDRSEASLKNRLDINNEKYLNASYKPYGLTRSKAHGKSQSDSDLENIDSLYKWERDFPPRRSLRTLRKITVPDICSNTDDIQGTFISENNRNIINLSRKDTHDKYNRQSNSENRPKRASAFNVRQTIEKRQIEQERRERKSLRKNIKKHLRSLSRERERKESDSSEASSCQNSTSPRSKSLNSLNEDEFKCESPLSKVQSSPSLESEKDKARSYLFESNLSDNFSIRSGSLVSRIMSPTFSDKSISDNKAFDTYEHNIFIEVEGGLKETSESRPNEFVSSKSNNLKNTWYNSQDDNFADCPRIKPINNFRSGIIHPLTDSQSCNSTTNNCNLADLSPIPPPRRRSQVSKSAGQLKVEKEERPAWLRLAKERRSLRSSRSVSDNFSDTASSIIVPEPDWVKKARKKLESMNVCVTSTTDKISVNSHITESSVWSRGGLDALEDLREEVTRISEEVSEEASDKVTQNLGIAGRERNSTKMLEFPKPIVSRESSSERPRVSFDGPTKESNTSKSSQHIYSQNKDETKFGDLKHDWGGVQNHALRAMNGKLKETRFNDIDAKQNSNDIGTENSFMNGHLSPHKSSSMESLSSDINNITKIQNKKNIKDEKLPLMHFGDTPQDIFTKSTGNLKSQSSSKFESIAGPDPTKMTVEELNQNVEEYDFPIPKGTENTAEELLNYLRENLNQQEIVPEIISNENSKPKPKSILKRKSVENVSQEINEEKETKSPEFLNNTNPATIEIGKTFLFKNNLIDQCLLLRDRQNNQNNKKLPIDKSVEVGTFDKTLTVNVSPDSNDRSLININKTNDSGSITNAASNFFNVKLRHVDTNKISEAKNDFKCRLSPSPEIETYNNFSIKHSKNISNSIKCYEDRQSKTIKKKENTNDENEISSTAITCVPSGKIKVLKESFENGELQELSEKLHHDISKTSGGGHEKEINNNEENNVTSVIGIAANFITQKDQCTVQSRVEILKGSFDKGILDISSTKSSWMSCRNGQLNQAAVGRQILLQSSASSSKTTWLH